ncbi:RDD family protein [Arthrobacter sp. AZCC_0090]|uniref:RDD family protein n=1 Tax=Arthrobacter sp. AZCC_0090 TaxID=2735881 RepID=UPI001851489B|nr:RDD family protein [Arthrobacter sp. AZCC_0090]MBB6403508.1 hypothetical protein [Arthrobacter sp. AZCC_0090]
MNAKLELVPASAGKRLGAAVFDWLGPAVVLGIAFGIGFAGITQSRSNGFIVYDTGLLVLLGSIALGMTIVYTCVLLGLEAHSGTTIGNGLMGIRSTDTDGYAPGAGVVFVRGIITGGMLLLAALASAVLLLLGWLGVAVLLLVPLLALAAAWAVVVVVSNTWDKDGKARGWQDKAAKSFVFDISAGRNPVVTGGIQGPYSFAPVELPPVQHVSSPAAVPHTNPATSPPLRPQAVPAQGNTAPLPPHNRNQWQPPAAVRPLSGMAQHPDDDVDRTQLRPDAQMPQARAVLRIRMDDGQDLQVANSALVGRNPAAMAGETVVQLIAVADPGRSISKTHLHLRGDGDGVWITDRNSTNGSAVTTPDGVQTRLLPGEPLYIRPGSTVHFGDRTFHLGQA